MFLELAPNGTLANLITSKQKSNQPFPESQIIQFLEQILNGLRHIHNKNLIQFSCTRHETRFHDSLKCLKDDLLGRLGIQQGYISHKQYRLAAVHWGSSTSLVQLLAGVGVVKEFLAATLDKKVYMAEDVCW